MTLNTPRNKIPTTKWISCFTIAAVLRFLLMISDYQKLIGNRVEVTTALNSWKRLKEGIYLQDNGIDPYSGDLFHQSPINLVLFGTLQKDLSDLGMKILFICMDLAVAVLLAMTAKRYVDILAIKWAKEDENLKIKNKKNDEEPYEKPEANYNSMLYVAVVYLYNPYTVMNCVGFTTTVFTNLLYSISLYSMINLNLFIACISISLLTVQEFYPISLMVPVTIFFVSHNDPAKRLRHTLLSVTSFIATLSAVIFICYSITGDWSFLRSTIGFILTVPDLRPNIGIYWYFFTEMFEHFKWLFIVSFQLNVSIVYVTPLALRFRQDPMLLSFAYLAIIAIFKSYPCIGDVGFYMSLLPMWKHLFGNTQQGFIVGCFMLFCTLFAPTVWHQWIYSQSANANFYFGVTLAFATAQIFLLTDILFASVKREFAIRHGAWKNDNSHKLLLE